MNDIITLNNYEEFKQKFDTVMQETAERFVVIGYLLKVARDTDILKESGYKSMGEFALKRYGLTKDIASRYIAINDRYSEGGYSEQLDQRYKSFGYAKLAEMLTLPDVIVDQIGTDMTKEEIRAIKTEVREEEAVSDIEVLIEAKDEQVEQKETILEKALHQICHEHPEIYEKLWVAVNTTNCKVEDLVDILAPSGNAIITCRIPGTGRIMVSIKGLEENLQVINVRTEEKEEYTWQALRMAAAELAGKYYQDYKNWENCWELTFKEYLKKQKVAPAQPKRVTRSVPKPAENVIKPAENEKQIPGQMEVQDYPEMMPKEKEDERDSDTSGTGSIPGADTDRDPDKTRSYQERREEAEEAEKALHELLWCWEGLRIPKEELEKLLENAKKFERAVEKLLELEE